MEQSGRPEDPRITEIIETEKAGEELVRQDVRSLQVITEKALVVQDLTVELHELVTLAGELDQVTDQKTLKDAADVLGMIKGVEKKAEDARKASKGHLLTAGRQIDGFFKPIAELALKTRSQVDQKILSYHRKLEAERRRVAAEEQKAREVEQRRLEGERRKAMKADDAAALAKAENALQVEKAMPVLPPPAPTRIRSGVGTTSIRKDWTFKIVDLQKIPKVFFQLDTAAIRKAIADGSREIPGLEIFQVESVSTRRSS